MNAQTLRRLSFFIFTSSLAAVSSASAATLEIAGYGGLTIPFYEQTFTVSLAPPANVFPGVSIQQERPLSLNAKSGLILAGGATLYLGALGIEARYDAATVDITSEPPLYSVALSRPFPNFRFTLEPAPTVITISNLTPVSLNLKLRTPGPLRFFLSGGVSYLPDFQLAVQQKLALSVAGIPLPPGTNLGSLTATAVTRPEDDNSHLGGNAGLGLQIQLGEHVSLVGEARGFFFPKQVLSWQVSQQPGFVTLPSEVTNALAQQLQPIQFNPAYFHLVGGIAFTF